MKHKQCIIKLKFSEGQYNTILIVSNYTVRIEVSFVNQQSNPRSWHNTKRHRRREGNGIDSQPQNVS